MTGMHDSSHLKAEIAQAAAALVVDEGLEYGPAKRRALKQLGLPPRTELPDNGLVEDAVREHIALFCEDTQPAELRALRELALVWMKRLAEFRPHLGEKRHRQQGETVGALSLRSLCKPLQETIGVHLMIYDRDDVRGALRPDAKGRSPRGDAAAVARLLEAA